MVVTMLSTGAIRYGIADQIAAVQIENWRQIQFLAKQTELCHIGDPLLVWLFRRGSPGLTDLAQFCPLLPYKSDTSSS
mgnify:CR=1 FL=1